MKRNLRRSAFAVFGALVMGLTLLSGTVSFAEEADEIPVRESKTVSTFLGEKFYDGKIETDEDAYDAVYYGLEKLGINTDGIDLDLSVITPTEDDMLYYTFAQVQEGVQVYGATVKLIVNEKKEAVGLVSSLLTGMKVEKLSKTAIDETAAEKIIEDYYKGEKIEIIHGATELTVIPESDDSAQMIYAWIVYTKNFNEGSEQAFLAHYVDMDGEYLYYLPVSEPGNSDALAGTGAALVFKGMESETWTGTIKHNDGTKEEIEVPLIYDPSDDLYYLGDLERKIVCADHSAFDNDFTIDARASEDGITWQNDEMITYYNFLKVYDFFNDLGWSGPDGNETPCLLLMDLVDEEGNPVENAYYSGLQKGFQVFAFNRKWVYGDCIDVVAHEFAHCITAEMMTTNLYYNDYGAINEAFSDMIGNLVEMYLSDEGYGGDWTMAENVKTLRSMKDPHKYQQPEYVWDTYYYPNAAKTSSETNDNGGVHVNSSLLNKISYDLYQAGMDESDQIYYWMNVSMAMTPLTDFPQLAEIMPWVMKNLHYDKYLDTLNDSIEASRIYTKDLPEELPANRGLIYFYLPDAELLNDYAVDVQFIDADNWDNTFTTIPEVGSNLVLEILPPGDYQIELYLTNEQDSSDTYTLMPTADGWVIADRYDFADSEDSEKNWDIICTIEDGDMKYIETDSLGAMME